MRDSATGAGEASTVARSWGSPVHIDLVEHRHGVHGPGYLQRGGQMDAGVLRLGPGHDTVNHFHLRLDEVFVVIEGTATMWLGTRTRMELTPGETYFSPAGEPHYFVNEGSTVFRALFVKSPFDPMDTNPLPWTPAEGPLDEATLQGFRARVAAGRGDLG